MIKGVFSLLVIGFQLNAQVTLKTMTMVAHDALRFEGEKGIDYHFNPRITPHGDCIKVAFDHIYITWYKGGMENRQVMLSRKKIGTQEWSTIEFPHRHIGYRGNPNKGDSHNTIAIGISPQDSTIHLIYDMHAYSEELYGVDFFNYSKSIQGAATASEEEWNIDLFHRKKNYLRKDQDYDRATYPNFSLSDDGKLFVFWRLGGSGNGNHNFAFYDHGQWSENIQFNNGNQTTTPEKYSIYGRFKHFNGQLMSGFAIRYRDFPNENYTYNSGLYFAYSLDPSGRGNWHALDGTSLTLPIQSPSGLKIAAPLELVEKNYMSSSPSWTVSPQNAYHFLSTVNDTTIHYFKSSENEYLKYSIGAPRGELYPIHERIYLIGLTEEGKPNILSTPEGSDEWKEEFIYSGEKTFRYGNSQCKDGRLFYYLMEKGNGDAQPIWVLEFEILKDGK